MIRTVTLDLSPAQLSELRSLLEQHLPSTEVWAYGSRIQGTARPTSDLDLVAFIERSQAPALEVLKEALEDSNLPFAVDLFAWHEVPESFQRNIQAQHCVLQGKSVG
ncbi:nucleotidyltransferase family protein [Aliagarivorans taiwanensis]|uniref:nucleotidyltransferase family protein n=1 Tax=Aliagarivorans taiwanensis TaxID=561966 RepID=UPI0003FD45F5|nr:nucleotidyltransferase domain-containing protein [Aliagarivorans taiwanensis]